MSPSGTGAGLLMAETTGASLAPVTVICRVWLTVSDVSPEIVKSLAPMAVDLLYGDAAGAKAVIENHSPLMSKEAYLAFQEGVFRTEVYDGETGGSEEV